MSLTSCAGVPKPPLADEHPVKLERHGDVRVDSFFWLKERDNPKTIAYLKAENNYLEAVMESEDRLREKLFEELKERLPPDDGEYPQKDGEFLYYNRRAPGLDQWVFCRRKGSIAAPEEILIDGNELARGQSYFHLGHATPNPDGGFLVYATDTVGRRFYTLQFQGLFSGMPLEDRIENVTDNHAWAADGKTLFYVKQDPKTLRADSVFRHVLGTPQSADVLVYREADPTFDVSVHLSRSRKFVFISSSSTLSTEVRFLEALRPEESFKLFAPRRKNLEYSVSDAGDRFLIRTNWKARDFRLMEAPHDETDHTAWKELVPHKPGSLLRSVHPFRGQLVLERMERGLPRIEILDPRAPKKTPRAIQFKEPAYFSVVEGNREFDSPFLRITYESLTTPSTTIDYEFRTGKQVVRKVREVRGGFSSANYVAERLEATARDGVRVPVSLVFKKSTKLGPDTPILLAGYGSYGKSSLAWFNTDVVSLLDRGFAYAILHVRGGSENGREWYETGRQRQKKNTFTDFIDATTFLFDRGISSPSHAYARGGSAGGLLMGALFTMKPELYRGIVADVPFLDVLTTMLDHSIPLTTMEFDEWGNPEDKAAYSYIKSYSPYDNLSARSYTNLLVTTAFQDSQVQYWEPAKFVARLRRMKQYPGLVLLHTEIAGGHAGKTGRFERLREVALRWAFLLRLEGKR